MEEDQVSKSEGDEIIGDITKTVDEDLKRGTECTYNGSEGIVTFEKNFLQVFNKEKVSLIVVFYSEIDELRKVEDESTKSFEIVLDSGSVETLSLSEENFSKFEKDLIQGISENETSGDENQGDVKVRTKEELEQYFAQQFPFVTEEQEEMFMKVKDFLKENELFLSDEHIMMSVICKKTIEKSCKTAKGFAKLMKAHDLYNVTLKDMEILVKLNSMYHMIDEEGKILKNKDDTVVFIMEARRWIKPKIPVKDYHSVAIKAVMVPLLRLFHDEKVLMDKGLTFIGEMKGFGWDNFDLALEQIFAGLLSKVPIRMKLMACHNMPWYGKVIYKLVYPFMTQKMKERFICVDPPKLLDYVDAKCLPENIVEGGTAKFDHDAWNKLAFGDLKEDEILLKKSF